MVGAGGFEMLLADMFGAKQVKFNGSKNYLEFWNGSRIWLSHCQHEKDLTKYQGPEIHLLLIDELTHFTEKQYRFLRGRCRLGSLKLPDKYKGLFPRIINGSNPGSIGHTWVKRTFVDSCAYGEIHTVDKTEGGMRRQYIPAVLADNPMLGDEYADVLQGLGSPELVRAMLNGDWDIVAGGALDDVWRRDAVVVPRFRIPDHWYVDRSFDWGSATPFSVGWWAVSDGEEVETLQGETISFPANSLIRFHEWYGSKVAGTNVGLKLSPAKLARGIIEREDLFKKHNIYRGKVAPGPADNQIGEHRVKGEDSIAKKMQREGITWLQSNKSPGSRMNGLELVRNMLENTHTREEAGLFVTSNCLTTNSTLPILGRDPKNPEDVLKGGEDHVYDELRYRVLQHNNSAATKIPTAFTY